MQIGVIWVRSLRGRLGCKPFDGGVGGAVFPVLAVMAGRAAGPGSGLLPGGGVTGAFAGTGMGSCGRPG
jgi:hypothetical protein